MVPRVPRRGPQRRARFVKAVGAAVGTTDGSPIMTSMDGSQDATMTSPPGQRWRQSNFRHRLSPRFRHRRKQPPQESLPPSGSCRHRRNRHRRHHSLRCSRPGSRPPLRPCRPCRPCRPLRPSPPSGARRRTFPTLSLVHAYSRLSNSSWSLVGHDRDGGLGWAIRSTRAGGGAWYDAMPLRIEEQ